MDDNHVFGIAGLPGAGKSEAASMIETELTHHFEDVETIEMSEVVREEYIESKIGDLVQDGVDSVDTEINDTDLGRWAAKMRNEHDNAYFARLLASYPLTEHTIVSGLRSPSEAAALKDDWGHENVTIIAIWTLPDIRFERLFGETPSEDHPNWQQFHERNVRAKDEWYCTQFFVDDGPSDYIVPNNSTMSDLEDAIIRIVHDEATDVPVEAWHKHRSPPFPEGLDEHRVRQYL